MEISIIDLSICDNFINNITEFIDELIELLKEDWRKLKHFYNENHNYIYFLFIAIITLQFTDVMSLGSSWNRYSKKNKIQMGGAVAGAVPVAPATGSIAPVVPIDDSKPTDDTKTNKEIKKEQTNLIKKEIIDTKKTKEQAKEDKKQEKKEADTKKASGDGELKDIKKKLNLFESLKGRVNKSAGKHGFAGPIFSNLDNIFGAVSGMFVFVGVILAILGILSLPILIFLIITYSILKIILGKLVAF